MAIKYVKDFEFPSGAGFSGSASDKRTTTVKSHERSLHDKLYDEGARRGFAKGGQVKMDDMDNATTQRTKALAPNQREAEFGDQPDVKPGFKKGGKIKNFNKHDKDAVETKM